MQDMIPPGDRSIRNIPLSHTRRPPRESLLQEKPPRPRRRRRLWLWALLLIIICAAGGLLLSTVFEGADVTITLKSQTVTPPATIAASLNAPAGSLAYQTMTLTESATTTVPANGIQNVSKEASGLITIYNGYSTAPQRLIANTRFETGNGQVYRIHVGVTIPGEIKSGSTMTSGSITATVYADQPGAAYNLTSPTQFSIPGFKGSPQYSKIYAQSQDPISGGLVGQQASVAPGDMTTAENALKQQLGSAIISAATSNVPSGFLLVTGSIAVTYSGIAETPTGSNTVALSQSATAAGAVVRTGDLAAAVARQTVSGYGGEAVDFADPSQISVSLSTTTPKRGSPLMLALSGNPTIVWQFDSGALKAALVGKGKSDFQGIIQTFQPAVSQATASLRPFWQSSFPSDPSKISISVSHN